MEVLICTAVAEGRTEKDLFGSRGVLRTVEAKTVLAYALGLISADERRELDLLRRVRNQMAHDLDVSFKSNAIADRCQELVLGERLYSPPTVPALVIDGVAHGYPDEELIASVDLPLIDLTLPDASDPRTRFYAAVLALTKILGTRIQLHRQGAQVPAEFASALELEDARIRALELALAAAPAESNSFESVVLKGFRYSRALIQRAMTEQDRKAGR